MRGSRTILFPRFHVLGVNMTETKDKLITLEELKIGLDSVSIPWSNISEKPFSSVGDGLTVNNSVLEFDYDNGIPWSSVFSKPFSNLGDSLYLTKSTLAGDPDVLQSKTQILVPGFDGDSEVMSGKYLGSFVFGATSTLAIPSTGLNLNLLNLNYPSSNQDVGTLRWDNSTRVLKKITSTSVGSCRYFSTFFLSVSGSQTVDAALFKVGLKDYISFPTSSFIMVNGKSMSGYGSLQFFDREKVTTGGITLGTLVNAYTMTSSNTDLGMPNTTSVTAKLIIYGFEEV